MKKDRLKDWEDKYWKGESSLEDEQNLKSMESQAYFNGLKDAKAEKMDWSFDEFVHEVDNAERVDKPVRKIGLSSLLKYTGIAAALILVGFIFLKKDNEPLEGAKKQQQLATEIIVPKTEESNAINEVTPEIVEQEIAQKTVMLERPVTTKVVKNEAVQSQEILSDDNYIVVNGQPIYNEEEAEEIMVASLRLMTNNLQEGKMAIDKIKYMKVEL